MEEYDFDQTDNPKVEKLKVVLPVYVPTIVTATATVACIIGSHTISSKRTAALASLYSVSEMAMKEYQKKVIDTIGEKKEQKVRDEIDKDLVERTPITKQIVLTGTGDHIIFDAYSGRYFKSNIDKIKQTVNEFNSRLISEMELQLNEFYYELGLEGIPYGNEVGWEAGNQLEVDYSSQLTDDGTPCLVMNIGRPSWHSH